MDAEDGDPAHRASAPAEDAAPSPPPVHRLTVQMLPGRLVPVDRTMLRQEIHFLRPSREGLPITLGGARRDPPDHVTIQHPSLERKHASMRYRGGHWWIESLVSGRPVILNGRPIPAEGGARHLKDGDRVTLGEVDFHFEQP